MADSKITGYGFIDKVWNTISGTTLMAGAIVGTNIRITMTELAKYVLGNRTIGGNTAGAIVTLDGSQTLGGGKRFNSLRVNSDTVVTPTSEELNHVDGVTSPIQTQINTKAPINNPTFTGVVALPVTTSIGNVSATEIVYLNNVTSPIQGQFNNISELLIIDVPHIYSDIVTLGVGVTSLTVTQAEILSYFGLTDTEYSVNHKALGVSLYQLSNGGGTYTGIAFGDGTVGLKITKSTYDGQDRLNQIQITGLSAEKDYCVAVSLMIMTAPFGV